MRNIRSFFAAICLGLLISIASGASIFASENAETAVTVISSADYIQASESSEKLLFLFSSGRFDAPQSGDIYLFFSNIELNSSVTGNIYCLFSSVTVNNNAVVNGEIKTLSSKVLYTDEALNLKQFTDILSFFLETGTADGYYYHIDRIDHSWAYVSLIQIVMVYLAAALKRGFIEQSGQLLYRQPIKVIRNGIITYLVSIVTVVLFLATLFLLPFALIAALTLYAAVVFGEASLSLIIGLNLFNMFESLISGKNTHFNLPATIVKAAKRLKLDELKNNPTSCILTGVIIIETLRLIPILSWGFSYIFLPILALGMTFGAIMNRILYKTYYPSVFWNVKKSETGSDFDTARKILKHH